MPMDFAISSVNNLLKYVFFTLCTLPDGKTDVRGIGGSPSPCCRLSATTRNAL